MKHILPYKSFLNEGITGRKGIPFEKDPIFKQPKKVTNIRRVRKKPIDIETRNYFVTLFNENPESLKKFILSSLKNIKIGEQFRNLRFLGNGMMGLAFEWLDNNKEKVIKFTTDKTEYENCKNIIGKNIPGIAKYYWAEKIKTPKKSQILRYLNIEKGGKVNSFRIDKPLIYVYVICLEKLTPLTEDEMMALWVPVYLYWRKYLDVEVSDNENKKRLSDFYNWYIYDEQSDVFEPTFSCEFFDKKPTRNEINNDFALSECNLTTEDVKNAIEKIGIKKIYWMLNQYLSMLISAKKNKISTQDLHLGNMALNSSGRLVGFDFIEYE